MGGLSQREQEIADKILSEYPNMPEGMRSALTAPGLTPDQRVRQFMGQAEVRRAEIDQRVAELKVEERELRAGQDVTAWVEAGVKMERPDGSSLHQLLRSISRSEAIIFCARRNASSGPTGYCDPQEEYSLSFLDCRSTFIVRHDWAAAFENAADYADGAFRLPFDSCVFEFRYSGRKVLALARQVDGGVALRVFVSTPLGWTSIEADPEGKNVDGNQFWLMSVLLKQIRAVCIALDAEVVETETVRAPHKLNKAREKRGEPPLRDYHVVSLANRKARAAPLPEGERGTHRSPRLHFRRGHWRHFETHKTWIKWMLVGNPDLGFVEKEYRL